jgi:hypothetical protein
MKRRSFLGFTGVGGIGLGGSTLLVGGSPTYRIGLEAATFEYVLSMRSYGPDVGEVTTRITDLEPDVRETVETAIEEGRVGIDDPSTALLTFLDRPEAIPRYVVDGSVRPSDPARIELSISNTGDERIGVSSGAPGPFGVLRAESEGGDDRVTLWSDAYAESDHVHTTTGRVRAVNDVGIVTELASGETRTRAYEIGRWRLEPGTYTVDESIGIERYATDENGNRRSEGTTFPYELRIRIG